MYRSPIFYAVLAFVISLIVIGILMPALVCMDGWQSESIGKQGACSHHGGVNYIPVVLGVIISYAISFFVWKIVKKNELKLKSDANRTVAHIEKTSSSFLQLLNRFLCKFWNFIILILSKIGIGSIFNKAPIITVIVGFVLIIIIPPIALSVFILGVVAYFNGASAKSGFSVPDIE